MPARKKQTKKYDLRTKVGRAAHTRNYARMMDRYKKAARSIIETMDKQLSPPSPSTAYWKVGV